ncbi:DNA glycosylase [Streptomyces sp. PTM05]|uniref:DNA-(apurinic or apyrimidinic site) lyase n=1 Tax=Streptantibioticus parmotrematis TaxID=2873249 RepID=A0ABS7QWC7_9ACTN|nr:DNA-formamidopyrimidine glycosylase family protein [Streptantibioticus parmotrematis]MBY8887208.1 DNA glycosylase [Streptantibioticus parmotrematis]
MPEGDTVWLTARRLRQALAGRELTRTDLRVPRLATTDLTGCRVEDVVPRGKHLLMRVEGGWTLHSHLRMDGQWRVYPAGERWHGSPQHQIRAILANADSVAVGYRLPVLELVKTAQEDTAVGHLGPDLLGPDWDPAEAVRRLLEDPGRTVGEALLDQRNLAGIGNVYKSELCFLRGVTPWTPMSEVGDPGRMVVLAQELLEANKARHGHVTTGDLRRGRTHWVYNRAHRPCLRCGALVRTAPQGPVGEQRVTYWCPSCQNGPPPPGS